MQSVHWNETEKKKKTKKKANLLSRFFSFFLWVAFYRLYSRMDNSIQKRIKKSIERRTIGQQRKEEKRKKREDRGQHLRAGSKDRTTVYDKVNTTEQETR